MSLGAICWKAGAICSLRPLMSWPLGMSLAINLHSWVRFAQLSRPGCSDRFSFHFLITEVQGPVSLTLNLLTLSLLQFAVICTHQADTDTALMKVYTSPHKVAMRRIKSPTGVRIIILKHSSLHSHHGIRLTIKDNFFCGLKKTRFRFPFLSLLTAASFVSEGKYFANVFSL